MQLEVKNNNFIKLNELIKIQNFNAHILNYDFYDNKLIGKILIEGEALKNINDLDEVSLFSEEMDFEILFTNGIMEVSNVSIKNVDFFEVEGRGIEVEFTLLIEYAQNMQTESAYESVIQRIESDIDEKLEDEIFLKEEESETIFPTKEAKTRIRIKF